MKIPITETSHVPVESFEQCLTVQPPTTLGYMPLTAKKDKILETGNTTLKVSTYTVRTVRVEKIASLKELLSEIKWDVVGTAEIKKTGEGLPKRTGRNILYYKKRYRWSWVSNKKNMTIELRINLKYSIKRIQVYF